MAVSFGEIRDNIDPTAEIQITATLKDYPIDDVYASASNVPKFFNSFQINRPFVILVDETGNKRIQFKLEDRNTTVRKTEIGNEYVNLCNPRKVGK